MSDDYLSKPINISSSGECKWFLLVLKWKLLLNVFSLYWIWIDVSSSSSSSLFSSPSRQQQQSLTAFSPYLNYDPRLLQKAQPEFIFPEGASKQRGRFELAFSQIGSAVLVSILYKSVIAVVYWLKIILIGEILLWFSDWC